MNDNSAEQQECPESSCSETKNMAEGTILREDWMTKPKDGWLSAPQDDRPSRRTPEQPPPVNAPRALDLANASPRSGRTTVGDGGASWRLKALKRMQERSKQNGTSLNKLAQQRGYNLDQLKTESTRKSHPKSEQYKNRRNYLDDVQTDQSRMRKPKVEDSSFTRKKQGQIRQTTSSPKTLNKFPNDGSFFENFLKANQSLTREEVGVDLQQGDNQSIADQLRHQLKQGVGNQDQKSPVVVLPMIESDGRPSKGVFGRETSKKRRENEDSDDIATLYKRSKFGDDAIDIDHELANKISKNKRFGTIDVDSEYDFDVGTNLHQKRDRQKGRSKRNRKNAKHDREKRDAIREYRKMETIGERCSFCFGSKTIPKHLLISIGTMAYLRLPSTGSLDPFHCLIVPIEHLPSTRQVDEDVWTEIRNFKKCLILMNQQMDKDVIFLETAIHLDDHNRHAFVECIPVDYEVFQKAPMYFKKAIDDATADWSQHHSKRCIETGTKGLRGSIPENFPYFHVEFGISNGFVHVVDNEGEFDVEMGRRVLISLIGRPVEEMYQSGSRGSLDQQKKTVESFLQKWHPFDWTSKL